MPLLCFVFFFLEFLWQFRVHVNFRIICSSSVKKCHGSFDKGYIKYVDCFGKSGHLNTINSSSLIA